MCARCGLVKNGLPLFLHSAHSSMAPLISHPLRENYFSVYYSGRKNISAPKMQNYYAATQYWTCKVIVLNLLCYLFGIIPLLLFLIFLDLLFAIACMSEKVRQLRLLLKELSLYSIQEVIYKTRTKVVHKKVSEGLKSDLL